MRRLFILVLVLMLSPGAVAALPVAPSVPTAGLGLHPVDPADIVPPASLFREGANGKLSTDLVQLINPAARLPDQTRERVARGIREQRAYRGTPGVRGPGAEEVYVYVSLQTSHPTSLVDPFAQRVINRDEQLGLVTAWVAPDRLLDLASQPFVRSIRTVQPPRVDTGSVTTEGDALLKADLFRATLGHSGMGVKIGVISDGVNSWEEARTTGDLPADVHVLNDRFTDADEGTAMLEIVHDIAPGAELYFHDCGNDQIGFNAAITALANAGCQVIVDDIYWIDDPYFEDGLIAQHIDAIVRDRHIVYVTSAGNRAQRHYQGPYLDQGAPNANFHDFSNGGPTAFKGLYVNISNVSYGSGVTVVLQWDDRFGHSGNDYNLYLTNFTGHVVAKSQMVQNGNGDPLEGFSFTNLGGLDQDFVVWIHNWSAPDPRTLEVYVIPFGTAFLYSDNLVPADSIHGHKAASEAISVAAADVTRPETLESYSSRGPATIRWPSPETRQKPDIAGPDGNLISGAGGWGYWDGGHYRFYGTSASCPHVAAIAALIWSGKPTATASEVRAALLETADDRGPAGFDYGWGHGWPNALAFGQRLGVTRYQAPGTGAPVAAFAVHPQSGPAPLGVRFLDYSTGAATWSWDFGDGTTTVEREPLHTYTSPGRYTVSLTVESDAGITSTATKYDHIVATGPVPTPTPVSPVEVSFWANATAGPAPMAVQFTDASSPAPYHWWWTFGDGSSSTDANPVHTYAKAGTYTVNLSVWTSFGMASSSKTAFVVVGSDPRGPVANFTLSRTSGAAPLYVRFTDTSMNATSWRWDFGGLAWTTAKNPAVVFRQPGSYAVALTATNAYGSSTTTRNVTVTGRAGESRGAASIVVVG